MTGRDLESISARPAIRQAEHIGQATAVEQARAVAEVQAAVFVAQQMPRDIGRAVAEMRDACGRMGLAQRAFYSVPNRGNGPSVHLARELVRIWGNADYGVHELRRDDEAGISEIRAFAWDQQTNVRSSRTFVVPHARDTKQGRKKLVDLGDIYLNNQNIGARAVRESIYTILPAWFVDEAQDLCRVTLEQGEGKPLPQRIDEIVTAYAGLDVKLDQLEQKIGRKRGSWTPADLAELTILGQSIKRGEVMKDEAFPPRRVTAEDITQTAGGNGLGEVTTPPAAEPDAAPSGESASRDGGGRTSPAPISSGAGDDAAVPEPSPPAPGPIAKITPTQQANIGAEFARLEIKGMDRFEYAQKIIGHAVSSIGTLTGDEADRAIALLRSCGTADALDRAVSGS